MPTVCREREKERGTERQTERGREYSVKLLLAAFFLLPVLRTTCPNLPGFTRHAAAGTVNSVQDICSSGYVNHESSGCFHELMKLDRVAINNSRGNLARAEDCPGSDVEVLPPSLQMCLGWGVVGFKVYISEWKKRDKKSADAAKVPPRKDTWPNAKIIPPPPLPPPPPLLGWLIAVCWNHRPSVKNGAPPLYQETLISNKFLKFGLLINYDIKAVSKL